MGSLSRLWPFVWRSRQRLLLSFVFAALVALFWGLNLATVFPIVKVFLQGDSLQGYVERQITGAREEIEDFEKGITELEQDLATASTDKRSVHILHKIAKLEIKLTSASQRLAHWQWLNVYLIPHLPSDRFDMFAMVMGLLLVTMICKLSCMLVEDILVGSVVQLTITRLRLYCFRKILLLDYQSFMRRGTPDLMSRFTYDIETVGNGLALLAGKLVREPLKAIACLGMAFWVNWRLALLSVLFVPVALFFFARIGKMLKKASVKSMESMSRIYKVLEESFEAIKVVIAFDGARQHRRRHFVENRTFYNKSMSIVTIDAVTGPIAEVLGMLAVTLVVLPGAYIALRDTNSIWGLRLSNSGMDVAELALLYTLLAGVIDPVRKLSSVFSKLKKATAAADRVFEMVDACTEVLETKTPRNFPTRIDQIAFERIGFQYAGAGSNRPAALAEASLKVLAGEVVAVVGENGSGKSTLVNLLPRFYDPTHGAVTINEIDIRQYRSADLRSRIGVVTQETLLFDDSIAANIAYGDRLATEAQLQKAADRAFVTQFLPQLAEGLATRVGERGTQLSGGQRQRIALARAMLRNPEILILDEATSAIDAQSERWIHEALREFVRGRTTFIITHHLTPTLLDLVTRIVVMERGEVVATGRHDELLAKCPAYQRLYAVLPATDSQAA